MSQFVPSIIVSTLFVWDYEERNTEYLHIKIFADIYAHESVIGKEIPRKYSFMWKSMYNLYWFLYGKATWLFIIVNLLLLLLSVLIFICMISLMANQFSCHSCIYQYLTVILSNSLVLNGELIWLFIVINSSSFMRSMLLIFVYDWSNGQPFSCHSWFCQNIV